MKSLGADFIEVKIKESGEGTGGYAKEMSKEFIEAEMELFLNRLKKLTLLLQLPWFQESPPPSLLLDYHVEAMKPGSIIVDLASETGGNCSKTQPGKVVEHKGVKIIGYTDFP